MNLIKKLPLMAFLLGFGFTSFMVLSSFIGGNSAKNITKAVASQEWFVVTVTGLPASDPANQTIGTLRGTPPAGIDSDDCTLDNPGEFCAVELIYDEAIDPSDFDGRTLEQVQSLYSASPNAYAQHFN